MSLAVLTLDSVTRSRRCTDEQLATAVARSPNMHRLLIALGLSDRGGNYETVWRQIRALGLDASHLRRLNGKRVSIRSNQEIIEAVKSSRSLAQVLASLGMRPGGHAQATLKKRIEQIGIDTSQFLGQAWRKGIRVPTVPPFPLDQVLVVGRFTPTNKLKARLIEAGLKEHRCEICQRAQWNGGLIPLELDHVNGRREDNRLANLRLLCPNCHAQTPTYRGRNIGSSGAYPELSPGGGIGRRGPA